MAHVAAAAASSKCILCAVADLDDARKATFSEEYPEVPTYNTLEEMLAAENLDAVSICLPTGMHADYAVRAMEAGVHALVESLLM
jgi:predicted dehydrogenase